jgi:hypothetical protein
VETFVFFFKPEPNELHKPARKNYPRRSTVTKGVDDLWQADLWQTDLWQADLWKADLAEIDSRSLKGI